MQALNEEGSEPHTSRDRPRFQSRGNHAVYLREEPNAEKNPNGDLTAIVFEI